jgi:hypothetical protein
MANVLLFPGLTGGILSASLAQPVTHTHTHTPAVSKHVSLLLVNRQGCSPGVINYACVVSTGSVHTDQSESVRVTGEKGTRHTEICRINAASRGRQWSRTRGILTARDTAYHKMRFGYHWLFKNTVMYVLERERLFATAGKFKNLCVKITNDFHKLH